MVLTELMVCCQPGVMYETVLVMDFKLASDTIYIVSRKMFSSNYAT